MSKVIIITGTRKGIGRYLSEYYLKKGMIVCGCSRGESDLKHDNYYHYCLDVSDEKAVVSMVKKVYQKFNHIDYLLNNAGIASMNHCFLTPLSVVENIFKTNVYGTFLFCREVGKVMSKNKFGRIINFTTVASPLNLAGEAVYAASKTAIEKLTEILAKEFGENSITVNSIGPSPIKTDLIKNVGKEKLDTLLSNQAIHDFGSFRDVSNVIDFYIKDESGMISGQTLYLGGVF
jgi:3-oxoacyl-[acyl-carrier protein] reductase